MKRLLYINKRALQPSWSKVVHRRPAVSGPSVCCSPATSTITLNPETKYPEKECEGVLQKKIGEYSGFYNKHVLLESVLQATGQHTRNHAGVSKK